MKYLLHWSERANVLNALFLSCVFLQWPQRASVLKCLFLVVASWTFHFFVHGLILNMAAVKEQRTKWTIKCLQLALVFCNCISIISCILFHSEQSIFYFTPNSPKLLFDNYVDNAEFWIALERKLHASLWLFLLYSLSSVG